MPSTAPDGHTVVQLLHEEPGERLVLHTRCDRGECATLVLQVPVPAHFGPTVRGIALTGKGSIEGLPAKLSRTLEGFRVRASLAGLPLVPRVIDAGVLQPTGPAGAELPRGHGFAWIATAWIPGRPIDQALASLDPPIRGGVLISLAEGLAALHGQGVLHGDLKPSNIIVGPRGPSLIDLETLRMVPAIDAPVRSLEYTPGYAAPEQEEHHEAYLASDVFAFGVVAASLCSGLGPTEAIAALRRADPIDGLPEGWHAVLRAAVAHRPQDRPRADEIAQQLIDGGRRTLPPSSEPSTIRVTDPVVPRPPVADPAPPRSTSGDPPLGRVRVEVTPTPPPPQRRRQRRRRRRVGARLIGAGLVMAVGFAAVIGSALIGSSILDERARGRACEGGDVDACYALGEVHRERGRIEAAEAWFLAGCRGADPRACAALVRIGEGYLDGVEVDRDAAKAAEAFRGACAGDDAAGCLSLGRLHARGQGVARDLTSAAEPLSRACASGAAEGCTELVDLVGDAAARATVDRADALRWMRIACDGGSGAACGILGEMHRDGEGTAPDPETAAALFRQACDAGIASGCTNLGIAHRFGRGAPHDHAAAAALLEQACDGGHAPGCRGLGRLYWFGEGVPHSHDKAFALYRRACEGGDAEACDLAGD